MSHRPESEQSDRPRQAGHPWIDSPDQLSVLAGVRTVARQVRLAQAQIREVGTTLREALAADERLSRRPKDDAR